MEAPSFDINLESSQIDIFRKILEVFNIHQHHSKRVCKLHERLGERQGLLSVSGAIKLYKSYDLCLQSAKKQLLEVRLAQSVINNNTISQDEDDVASTFDSSLHSADNMINNSAEEIVTNLSSFHEYTDIKSEEDQMRAKRHNSYFGHGNRTNTSESTLGPKSEDDLHSIERLAIQSEEDRSIINIKSETISDLSSLRPGSLAAVYCHAEPGNVQKDWILASVVIQVNINLVNNTYDYEMQDYDLTPENNTSLSSLGAHGERGTLDSGIGGKRSPRKSGGLPTRRIVNSLDIKPIESTTDEEAIERLSSSVRAKSKVLALFPGTTCLYPATVISVPNRRRRGRDFTVNFRDDDAPTRPVPARFIIRLD